MTEKWINSMEKHVGKIIFVYEKSSMSTMII